MTIPDVAMMREGMATLVGGSAAAAALGFIGWGVRAAFQREWLGEHGLLAAFRWVGLVMTLAFALSVQGRHYWEAWLASTVSTGDTESGITRPPTGALAGSRPLPNDAGVSPVAERTAAGRARSHERVLSSVSVHGVCELELRFSGAHTNELSVTSSAMDSPADSACVVTIAQEASLPGSRVK